MSASLLAVFGCLLVSGLFSGVETAFTSLTVFQIENLKRRGWSGALVARLAGKPENLIATILIGNNLVNILASVLSTDWVLQRYGEPALAVMTGILTFLILVFGEVTPKRIAINHNESVALLLAPFVLICSFVFRPFVIVVNAFSSLVTRFFRRQGKSPVSMDNMIQMLSMAEHMGIIDYSRTFMVRNIFRLSATTVQAIMTHRIDVFSLSSDISCSEACQLAMVNEHSRIPVFSGSNENIIGIVTLHAVINEVLSGRGATTLASIAREPFFITPGKLVGQLFAAFKERKETFAVVIDEYGGLAGVVSMHDVIEEITGAIYETESEESREKVGRQADGSFLLSGDTPLSMAADLSDTKLPELPPVQTVAGYVSWVLDRLPIRGDTIDTDIGVFTVLEISSNRAEKLEFRPQKY